MKKLLIISIALLTSCGSLKNYDRKEAKQERQEQNRETLRSSQSKGSR